MDDNVRKVLASEAWNRGLLQYKLDSLQNRILKDVKKNNTNKILILSSRQIGKSYWSCCYALMYLLKNKNSIARIVAPTLDQAYDIVDDNLSKILEDCPKNMINRKKSSLRWDFANGSSLRIGGLKRAHVDSNRGGNASLVIYEECGFVDGDDFIYGVNSVLGPQLLRSAGREVYVSTPSADPDHPLHTKVMPECESNNSLYRYTVFDSPSISQHMIDEAIRRSGGQDSEAFRREYLAQIIRSDSFMIVPFDIKKHVRDFNLPNNYLWSFTIDWGGVRDKTVGLLHTYDFNSNTILIWDEIHWPANTPTTNIVKDLKNFLSKHKVKLDFIYADVPGQISVDLSNNYGITVLAPAKNDWLASVNNMASTFHAEKILIKPRCQLLIQTCYSGMFNKNRSDFQRTEQLGHCDALAALMYSIRSQDKSMPYENNNEIVNNATQFIPPEQSDEDNNIITYKSYYNKKKIFH